MKKLDADQKECSLLLKTCWHDGVSATSGGKEFQMSHIKTSKHVSLARKCTEVGTRVGFSLLFFGQVLLPHP